MTNILPEERHHGARRLIGDRQSLQPKLLLDLQRLQFRTFRSHIGIHKITDTGIQRIRQLADKSRLHLEYGKTPNPEPTGPC